MTERPKSGRGNQKGGSERRERNKNELNLPLLALYKQEGKQEPRNEGGLLKLNTVFGWQLARTGPQGSECCQQPRQRRK